MLAVRMILSKAQTLSMLLKDLRQEEEVTPSPSEHNGALALMY